MTFTQANTTSKSLIKELERTIKELQAKNQMLQVQNETLTQALLHAKKKMFGASSESQKQFEGQLSLFDEVQLSEALEKQREELRIKEGTRKPRKPGVRAEMIKKLPVEIIRYEVDTENGCPVCKGDLFRIASRVVRTEVVYRPAVLKVVQYVQDVYKCRVCGTEGAKKTEDHFVKAEVPKGVLPHSLISPSLVARILYQKYEMGIPLNRQEREWNQLGLVLSRATMANWVIRCSEEWLRPVYDSIHQALLSNQVLHCDETTIQCNREAGKKAHSNSYMWVLCGGQGEAVQGTLFHYTRSRGGYHAKELLSGYEQILVTDAYAGYEKVKGVKRALCWSHVRRYYLESIPLDGSGKEIPGSKGAEGRDWCDRLFKVEREIKERKPSEKEAVRKEYSKPILEGFWSWVEETSQMYTTNEKLKKALGYSRNQRKYLETFLTDGRIPLSNNWNENRIRNYAVGRRAWLFADTPRGAEASAMIYSIVETAKMNQLDVSGYFEFLFETLPNIEDRNHPEWLDACLPWSKSLPEKCRQKNLYQKQS